MLTDVSWKLYASLEHEAFEGSEFRIAAEAGSIAFEQQPDPNVAYSVACALARDSQVAEACQAFCAKRIHYLLFTSDKTTQPANLRELNGPRRALLHSFNFTYDSPRQFNHGKLNNMSDRKYNQRGYMQSDRESQRSKTQSRPQSKPEDREGPRSPRMMAYGEASKCTACGEKTPPNINLDSSCAKCNADLHSCRQCTYFDPGARLECSKTIAARIVDKHARNTCELFAFRVVVERQTSSGPPTGARDAFAKLFKK